MYRALEDMVGRQPVQVFLLRPGTFADYTAQRQAEGADLAHLKPPHMNPSEKVLSLLRPEIKVEAGEEPEAPQQAKAVALFLMDSTTTPLGARASYSGPIKRCDSYARIVGTVLADRSCTLYIEQTQDGMNWDYSVSQPVLAGIGVAFDVSVVAPQCRMRVVNGARAQTVLRAYMRARTA